MSSKKSRVGKVLKNIQRDLKQTKDARADKTQTLSSLNVSSIEKASFFEDDNISNHGNPLHSTALEDMLSPALQQPQTAVRRGATKGRRGSTRENRTPARCRGTEAKSRSLGRVSEGREAVVEDGTPSESEVATSSSVPSEEPSHSRGSPVKDGRKRLTSLSSEELSDEDATWNAQKGKKKLPTAGFTNNRTKDTGKKRKSGCRSSEALGKKKQKRQDVRNPTDLDIVLEAFQDLVSEYLETVDSESVKRAINALWRTFENRLMELISETTELNTLKKQNAKIDSTITRKRARLVEVKNELIKNELKLRKMEKEHAQLQAKVVDVHKSSTFLTDLRDLNREYLAHRKRHPNAAEVYGPSSLPALLYEARSVLGAEHQLKIINEKLQQTLDQASPS
ncbi:centromere protein U isoform X1 [Arapaima gigas]